MLFGTDGIRAKMGQAPLDAETIQRIGQLLLHTYGPGGKIVVGSDTRGSCQQLKHWLFDGFPFENILDLGVVPTPVVAFETRARGAQLGIMLTASHNPPEYNGLKFFGPQGYKLPAETAQAWSDMVENDRVPHVQNGQPELHAATPEHYEKFLLSQFAQDQFKGQTLAWDLANGAGSTWVPNWVRPLMGLQPIVGDQPNGHNINLGFGALDVAHLSRLVREKGLAGGMALDGDGDRLVVVDAQGMAIHGDRVLYGLYRAMLEEGHLVKDVVGTILTGLGLESVFRLEGVSLHRTPVGDQYVLSHMLEHGLLLGGEPSGHLIQGDLFYAGDGFLAGLRLTRAMARNPHFWAEVNERIPLLPTFEKNVEVRVKPPLSTLRLVSAAAHQLERTMGEQGRLILRYSGTEPKLRVVVESGQLSRFQGEIEALLQAIQSELGE
ncbi:MAG: hypothetical protein KDC71_03895 [Acidobacteria bacterium]|nr:hypothetical protein [Acidobacteriota bacterium]